MPPTTNPESAVLGDTEQAAHLDQAPGALFHSHPVRGRAKQPCVGERGGRQEHAAFRRDPLDDGFHHELDPVRHQWHATW
jgi:hypothetical protein